MRVSLKSVSGVDSVEVSLEKGHASVKMKPGNTATLSGLVTHSNKKSMIGQEGVFRIVDNGSSRTTLMADTVLAWAAVLTDEHVEPAGSGRAVVASHPLPVEELELLSD